MRKRAMTEMEKGVSRCVASEKWRDRYLKQCPGVLLLPDAKPDGILSRTDAVSGGIRWYRTGEVLPCGHAGWQYVSNDKCRTCGMAGVR